MFVGMGFFEGGGFFVGLVGDDEVFEVVIGGDDGIDEFLGKYDIGDFGVFSYDVELVGEFGVVVGSGER